VKTMPAAGSTLGANAFQQAPADGQTIYVPTNNHALMKLVYPQFAYDPAADFVPVALGTRQPFVLAVHPSVPANSVPELIAWLRERGTAANCGAAAPGAGNDMAAALLPRRGAGRPGGGSPTGRPSRCPCAGAWIPPSCPPAPPPPRRRIWPRAGSISP